MGRPHQVPDSINIFSVLAVDSLPECGSSLMDSLSSEDGLNHLKTFAFNKALSPNTFVNCVKAVSYTHLDVYKRQSLA